MPLIKMSVKHGRTLEDARGRLEMAVGEAKQRFGVLIQRVEWGENRDWVKLHGVGFQAEMRIDVAEVHVTGDIPMLTSFLGSNFAASLKTIVQQTFQKRLT